MNSCFFLCTRSTDASCIGAQEFQVEECQTAARESCGMTPAEVQLIVGCDCREGCASGKVPYWAQ